MGLLKNKLFQWIVSKAELYFNKFRKMGTPEIADYIKQLESENKAEAFLLLAWYKAGRDKEQLQEELKRISNFDVIDQALNKFGRKAQYIALSEFLDRIIRMYGKLDTSLKDKIKYYSLKAEDPNKLAVKISETQKELNDIENRLNQKVDEISVKYASSGNKGMIQQEAEKVMSEFKEEIKKLDADSDGSIEALEKASFRKVDTFIEFQDRLQKNVIAECNEALKVVLSEKNTIEFTSLEPDFTHEIVEEIKNDVKKNSQESYTYTTGTTFKKSHTSSRFSQKKFYQLFSDSITERLESIKNQAVRDLRKFVSSTINAYTRELARNANQKRDELAKIKNDKKSADETYALIKKLKNEWNIIEPAKKRVEELKGGIDAIV